MQRRGSHPRRATGFTLVEMLMVLTVGMILLMIGVPSFNSFIKGNRLTSQVNALSGTLSGARAEAIAQRNTVTVCGSSTGTSCNGAWGSGWISFLDLDADGTVDAGETVLGVADDVPPNVGIVFVGATTVRYNNQGFAIAGSSGTLRLCDDRGSRYGRALVVSPTGRVSVATDTDSPKDGIVDDANGNNIACP